MTEIDKQVEPRTTLMLTEEFREMAQRTLTESNVSSDSQEENFAAIFALITLLIFFFAYCCWGVSCKNLPSRMKFCTKGDTESSQNDRDMELDQPACNPTIILLPRGRILVVDGTVFAQFHSNGTDLDLFELGDSVLREEDGQTRTSSSILELEPGSNLKDTIPATSSPLPPTYESIFGDFELSLPPPYSEAFLSNKGEGNTNEEINSTI